MITQEFYFNIDNAVICKKDLNMSTRILYCYISNYWRNGLNVFANNKYLADNLGVSKSTISRALKELKDAKLIKTIYSRNENNVETRIIIKPRTTESELEKMFKRVMESKIKYSKEV